MGYRSDLGAVLSVDGWYSEPTIDEQSYVSNKYKELVGLIKLSRFYEILQEDKEYAKHYGWHDGRFVFHAEGWKWYQDYPLVKAWEDLWCSMQEVEDISGYFCRVGEEVNDVDEDKFGDDVDYDAFYPRTHLEFNAQGILGQRNIDKGEAK